MWSVRQCYDVVRFREGFRVVDETCAVRDPLFVRFRVILCDAGEERAEQRDIVGWCRPGHDVRPDAPAEIGGFFPLCDEIAFGASED